MEKIKETQKARRKSHACQKGSIRIAVIVAGVVVLLFAAYCGLCVSVHSNDTILPNTSVGGVDVSGYTVEAAAQKLESQLAAGLTSTSVQVEALGNTYTVALGDVLTFDWTAAAELGYSRGHGAFFASGWAWLASRFVSANYDILPYAAYANQLATALSVSGLTEVNSVVESTWEQEGDSLVIVLGTSGQVIDEAGLTELILAAIQSGDYDTVIQCPMTDHAPEALNLNAIYDEIYVAAENATLNPEDGYAIVESVTGVSFNVDAAQTALDAAAEGETVTIGLDYTQPDIDTDNLEANLFKDTLGSYTTRVSGSSARRSNVKLSASSCEVILLPGETFSYNDTVGQRTAARGYKEAAAYLNGETIQELGGGVCQTSSTLYVACLYANLEITERHNHTYASSYVPLGWDATVSWGGPDFKFTNNTNYPIKIEAAYSSSNRLTMSIIGTREEPFSVTISSQTYSTTPYTTEEIEDNTLSIGTTVVEQSGYTGYKVQTWRLVYDGSGNLISDDEEAYSVYRSRKQIVRVGTLVEETEEPSEADDEPIEPPETGGETAEPPGSTGSADTAGSTGSADTAGAAGATVADEISGNAA